MFSKECSISHEEFECCRIKFGAGRDEQLGLVAKRGKKTRFEEAESCTNPNEAFVSVGVANEDESLN